MAQEGPGHHIGEHGHATKWLGNLECARKAERADRVWAQADNFLAESGNRSGVRAIKTHDQVERSCLAGAVRTNQGERLVFTHVEAYVLHGPQAAKTLVQVFDDQHIGHWL